MNRQATPPKPVVPYTALLGRILQHHRDIRRLNQSDVASVLRISQSAYSRIEQGDTTISVAQLRLIARQLGLAPWQVLQEADSLAARLGKQGVEVSDEKEVSPAAVMIGLGILAALMMAK